MQLLGVLAFGAMTIVNLGVLILVLVLVIAGACHGTRVQLATLRLG